MAGGRFHAGAGGAGLSARYDGCDAAALARATAAGRVELRDTVGSALDVAHELAATGAPSGTLVVADEQTMGRGRAGRVWHSPAGGGVWMALVLRPAARPEGGALAIRAGIAAREAVVSAAPGLDLRLKWPNDLVVDGRKLGGILTEARWSGDRLGWVALGLGINVAGPLEAGVHESACALVELRPAVSRVALLAALVPRLTALAQYPPALSASERAAYLDHLWMPQGKDAVVDLEPDGALLLRGADGSLSRRTEAD